MRIVLPSSLFRDVTFPGDIVLRRDFLRRLGQGSVATALGCRQEEDLLLSPNGWGIPAPHQAFTQLPAEVIPDGVLELFLVGGLNPWDTFYVVPEHGAPSKGGPYAGQQWWTFQESTENSVPTLFDQCGGGSRDLTEPWATDANGKTVHLGPFIYPLRDRPDILSRMRVIVTAHSCEPHDLAAPYVLNGAPPGSARFAATGSHVERFRRSSSPIAKSTPYSYVLYSESEFAAFSMSKLLSPQGYIRL